MNARRKLKNTSINLWEDQFIPLDEIAAKLDRDRSYLIRKAVDEFIKRNSDEGDEQR